MNVYDLVFYLFGAITILSALLVVTARNIVHSAFYLLFTFFGVAGLYVLLGADFIAIVQLMVYIGGILILLIFGVMLTSRITSVDIRTGTAHIIPAIVGIGVLWGAITAMMLKTDWIVNPSVSMEPTILNIGRLLITDYVLIFELFGILLLIALIGAATIARRDQD